MKKWMNAIFIAVIVCCFIACRENNKLVDQSVTGIVKDATMNTLMLQTDSGKVYSFSTMDVQMETINGLLLGDKVQVFYQGKLMEKTEFQNVTVLKVVEIEQDPILGCWTQPIPGMEGVQGINLMEDGVAKSINMSTLVYQKWVKDSDFLILTGQSIGNEQTIDFVDTLEIKTLDEMNLVLLKSGVEDVYTKDRDMMVQ